MAEQKVLREKEKLILLPVMLKESSLIDCVRDSLKAYIGNIASLEALLTGIDQSDYSKIETGKRNMTFEQCRRIADALETSMDYLAGRTADPRPYPPIKQKPLK